MLFSTHERTAWYRCAFLRHAPRRYAVMQAEGADRKYDDYQGHLTDTQLAAHIGGEICLAVPMARAARCGLLALDIDAGGMQAATLLIDAAACCGFWAFAQIDEARERGYVWVPFNELADAARVKALGEQLLQVGMRPGFRVENRVSYADTRLPMGKHRWTERFGTLLVNDTRIDLDADLQAGWTALQAAYTANSTTSLPPAPEKVRKPESAKAGKPGGNRGYTIDMFNAEHDLVGLLDQYGAKQARGQGRNLWLCPFHDDNHASLLVNRDGDKCRCMSQGSDCPLSGRQYDAFHVFCIGERIDRTQALRRLNGLSDDPEPPTSLPPVSSQNGPGRSEPQRGSIVCDTPPAPQVAPENRESEPDLLVVAATDPNLTRATVAVLGSMLDRADAYQQVYASVAQYAESAACSERSARYALRRLETHGYVEVLVDRGRRGETTIYRIAGRQSSAPTWTHESHDPFNALMSMQGGQADPPDCTLLQSEPEPFQIQPETCTVQKIPLVSQNPIPHQEATVSRLYHGCITDRPPFSPDSDTHALEADDGVCGPFGAYVCPGGASYVPPEAASWYAETFGHALEKGPDEAAFSASGSNRITDFTLSVRLDDTFRSEAGYFAARSNGGAAQQDAAERPGEEGAEGAENVSLPRETRGNFDQAQLETYHSVSSNVHAFQRDRITESHTSINDQVSLSLSHLHTHTRKSVCVSGERDPDERDENDRTEKKKRRKTEKPFDPQHLLEKIAIAEQKARKLALSSKKADQRQAYAIQQSIQQLKYRLDRARDEIGLFRML